MVELISLKDMPTEAKLFLLKELGYNSDGEFVIKNGKKHTDKYTGDPIKIANMIILPGRSPPVILDNNQLSVTSYLEEYGDVL
jgi:hypothetical protein